MLISPSQTSTRDSGTPTPSSSGRASSRGGSSSRVDGAKSWVGLHRRVLTAERVGCDVQRFLGRVLDAQVSCRQVWLCKCPLGYLDDIPRTLAVLPPVAYVRVEQGQFTLMECHLCNSFPTIITVSITINATSQRAVQGSSLHSLKYLGAHV